MPLRPYQLHCNFLRTTPSCLVECGGTRVLCTASITEGVPPFLKGAGKGWLTAEYAMLPASTRPRKARDGVKKDGRGVEISRLIGRALRQAVDLTRLGERTITIDCDVLEADGGTRTASITGGFVALTLAIDHLIAEKKLFDSPIVRQIAAVSVGIIDGEPQLDLCYAQDSRADVDMNVVMDEKGNFIEVQGTGEGAVFSRPQLNTLLDLATEGITELHAIQRQALGEAARWIAPKLPRLLFATGNAHKVRELSQILKDHYQVLSLKDVGLDVDVEEDGDTFAANARIKAETICRMTGIPALADDSGLVVDALGGAPGVHSARYAGKHGDDEANLWLVLKNMEGVPDDKRSCRFVCAMALARPGMETLITEGAVEGMMAHAPRGNGGFGYDPIFIYRDGLTFSEVSAEEKNQVSHRAQAARKIVEALC